MEAAEGKMIVRLSLVSVCFVLALEAFPSLFNLHMQGKKEEVPHRSPNLLLFSLGD